MKAHLEEVYGVVLTSLSLQPRVWIWLQACFGDKIARDKTERCHRFYEEATELVQAGGMTREDAHRLVDYTYGRPTGELDQEVGGVMVTLAALCLAFDLDMHAAGEREITRIWTLVDKIRAKQAAKPHGSPLPEEMLDIPYIDARATWERMSLAERVAMSKIVAETNGQIP